LKLRAGVNVRIQGIRVRTGLSGDFELTSIPLSRLEILEAIKDRPAWEDIRHVIALEAGLSTWVKGVVIEVLEDPKVSLLCETCGSEMKFEEDKPKCENCGQPRSSSFALSTRIRLDDGTGVIGVRLLHTEADTIFDRKAIENQMLQNHVTEIQLGREQGLNLIGKEVEVKGIAEASPDNGKLEFNAKKVLLATP
jgi:ribosomal protein L37E